MNNKLIFGFTRAFIFSILILINCICCKNKMIDIGVKLPKNTNLKEIGNLMTSSASVEKAYHIKLKGISYTICLDSDNLLNYLATNDTNFITEEGIRIGMSLNNSLITSKDKMFMEPGFAYILPLESGWYAQFAISDYDKGTMTTDSTVRLLFKREGL